MKNIAKVLVAILAASACSQVSALASEQKLQTMYVLGSTAQLPTRPNREMLGELPMPAQNTMLRGQAPKAADVQVVASTDTPQVQLRGPITTNKGWW